MVGLVVAEADVLDRTSCEKETPGKPTTRKDAEVTCQQVVWRSFTRTFHSCQVGFFLRGLNRGSGNQVGSIEWGKCCKPSHHPYNWGDCYNEDVSNTFNKAGLSECTREGYFIAGFETWESGGRLSSIKKFKCCKMWNGEFLESLTLLRKHKFSDYHECKTI